MTPTPTYNSTWRNSNEDSRYTPAEVLYAFMGWLTSQSEVTGPFSENHNTAQAANLVERFIRANHWSQHNRRSAFLTINYPSRWDK